LDSIAYYEHVRAFLKRFPDGRTDRSRPIEDFHRLFMVPGMGHCGGGAGPNNFGQGNSVGTDPERDIVAALERWVEKGIPPETLIGTGRVPGDPTKKLSRPLCVYPKIAQYKGSGDPNDASSFTCAISNPK
jgi:feruloyl esterase